MRGGFFSSLLILAITVLPADSRALKLPAKGESVDVESILNSMTLEERVGQLIMIGFGGTQVTSHIRHWIKKRKVGGATLFSRNIKDLEQTARFARELHALTREGVPLFLALDQEGGNVVRVKDGAVALPGNMALGATRSQALAYSAGQAVAVDLKLLGFNMNLAPVLDVNSNPKNPVIGVRSYGERPELVGRLGSWYIRGHQQIGVAAVAKHFPGHGDTQSDSHFSMPSINADLKRLREVELAPFRTAIDAGLDAVMTAHIRVPAIAESPNVPATLSRRLLTDILRKELGFTGVVITDGLEMQGIVERYGSGRAAVAAVLAGADMAMILWTPEKKEEVYHALLQAVRSGQISEKRLNASVRRILRVKQKRGLFKQELLPVTDLLANRNRNALHDKVVDRIAREAITLVRNVGQVLPINRVRHRKVVVLAPPGAFGDVLEKEPNVEVVRVPFIPNRERRQSAINAMLGMLDGADLILAGVVNRYHIQVVQAVHARRPEIPTALFSFASPYYLESLPKVDAYVCAYSYLEAAQRNAALAALGTFQMNGRLPISIPGLYPYGHAENAEMALRAEP